MEDQQFDEIMEKYVSSTIKNKEEDLKYVKKYTRKHRIKIIFKFVAVAVILSAIVFLSIFLPIALKKKSAKTKTQFFDGEQIKLFAKFGY